MTPAPTGLRNAEIAGYVSLLTSAGTLACCALPALLVTVGAGAVLASAVTVFPALVWLSEYKIAVFTLGGAMLAIAGVLQRRVRALPCPVDPEQAAVCARTRRAARVVYAVSVVVFAVGASFAFVVPLLL